ncbi:metallophosphoesterase [Sphingobacterium sp. Mn56C]|uniref:metallophosphoesterase n=1 Tax=Sphingobacterium sp. Mn56C TaxID=3395261 RepID=UPI003BE1B537
MLQRIVPVLLLFVLGDIYFYQAVVTLTASPLIHNLYWFIDILVLVSILSIVFLRKVVDIQHYVTGIITALLLVILPKVFSFPLLLLEDFTRIFRGFPSRSILLSEIVVGLAVLMFLLIVFGLTKGRHFYQVRKETLYFSDLPKAFDGFTITQLSDIHAGSLTNKKAVQRGIDLANAQQSDLLLFTGDMVNYTATEVDPWIKSLSLLKAPFGKFSILGNHDYGDYSRWDNTLQKEANLKRLKEAHAEMDFTLLLNDSVTLTHKGERISLIGVENWGKGGFHQYGDLNKATANVDKSMFKILMSHDPSHWDEVAVDHPQHMHLTLSGHTHGMQFGIELFGFKWSPIQYFYKQWAGLYERTGKYLYVNRGFGFHGLKGRVGVWPEITVLTLKTKA